MLKHLKTYIPLFIVVLLAACAPVQTPVPAPAPTATQPLPAATAPQNVVTLVPAAEVPPAEQPTPVALQPMDENGQAAAMDKLRAVLGAPKLELAFKGFDHAPNAANQAAVLFVDSLGNSYYIRQDTLQPIEFTIVQMAQSAQGNPKSQDELRAIAEQFAKEHSTKWEAVKDRLAYTEGNKSGENYFFRWEMPGTDMGGGMPAILQIGLKQDGRLFAFLNSLDFLP